MPIAFRHRDDARTPLPALAGFAVHQERDAATMADLQRRAVDEIAGRFAAGHRAYVATVDGRPAAWGWVATRTATIGELRVAFTLAPDERYLWNFVTLPEFRGRGIYPRLLAAILDAEAAEAERYWIAYAPENHASGAGIVKAGFALTAQLSFDRDGAPVVQDLRAGGGAAAARLLGIADTAAPVAKCWKCARGADAAGSSCREGSCGCDYQRPEVRCGP